MDVIKKYKFFIKESKSSSDNIKSLADVPEDVTYLAKKIVSDVYDKVKNPKFEFDPERGLIMTFTVSEQDFRFIDTDEVLTLDITEGSKKKRSHEVKLEYLDRISETFEVKYIVKYSPQYFKSSKIDNDEEFEIEDTWHDYSDVDDFDEEDFDKEISIEQEIEEKNKRNSKRKNKREDLNFIEEEDDDGEDYL